MIVGLLVPAISRRLSVLPARASVRAVADAFSESRVGLIVIANKREQAVGVVSKSDLVRYLAHFGPPARGISDVMTWDIISCAPSDLLSDVWKVIQSHQLQSVPVLERDGRPVGMLDARDALQALLREQQDHERFLLDYISGRGYGLVAD